MNSFFCLKQISKRFLPFVMTLFIFNSAIAGIEPVRNSVSTPALTETTVLTVQDNKYGFITANPATWENSFHDKKVINRVVFSINQSSEKVQPVDYTATINFELTYKTWDANNHIFVSNTVTKALEVEHKNAASYKDKAVYELAGAYAMNVRVTSLTAKDANQATVSLSLTNLSLEAVIETERYYAFDPLFLPTVLSHKSNALISTGELEIYWDVIPGAEEYDLEWVYINNYDKNGASQSEVPASELNIDARIFQFNSTRISTTDTYYKIPYVYGKGYILYRIRGAGKTNKDSYDKLMNGIWSTNNTTFSTVAAFDKKFLSTSVSGFFPEDKLNTQFAATYAEGGKSKAVVNYFDGSMRTRQSVTKSKTIDQIIVGESIYDHQGRPAVQVLPVPVQSSKLNFNPNFNRNTSDLPYSKEDFDKDAGNCNVLAEEMKAVGNVGASNYYSSENLDREGQQAYVPDAQLYPFTQTEYTPDNTGRISTQGGVGKMFQLGKGHETRYFYSSPEQEELDRLFGSEAGNALHYKKNMVRDANGQLSISFLDPQGRTVASCLAGNAPLATQELDNAPKTIKETDLLGKVKSTDFTGERNELNLATQSLTVNRQINPEAAGAYIFKYEMKGAKFQTNCLATPICYDCIFDLKIKLTDECGQGYLAGAGSSDIDIAHAPPADAPILIPDAGTAVSYPADCNGTNFVYEKGKSPVDSWKTTKDGAEVELDPNKTYQLTKTLTVNQKALDKYTENYLKSNCVKTFQSFLDQELINIDLSSCDPLTCQECADSLGPYSRYNKDANPACSPCLTKEAWQALYDQCFESCNQKSATCEGAYQNMLMDVSIMGQYGQVMPGNGVVDGKIIDIDPTLINPEAYPLSVFNEGNQLPRKDKYATAYMIIGGLVNSGWAPTWRFPYNPHEADNNKKVTYLDEDGNIAKVIVKQTGVGSYIPEVISNSFVETNPVTGVATVHPQFLKNISDFISVWQDSWATSLVCYHPEYDYYEFCLDISDSHDFDENYTDLEKVASPTEIANLPGAWRSTSWPESNGRMAFMDPVKSGLDPYFLPYNPTATDPAKKGNPHYSFNEKEAMKYAMLNYSNGKSIWEIAYMTTHCPYGNNTTGGLSCSSCTYNGENFDNETWNIFKTMYFSLKQRFQQQVATRYAIQQGSYNGCIGVADFDPFLNNFYQSLQPGTSNHWSFPPFNFFFRNSQYFNFEQPCNWARQALYKEKQKRFPGVSDLLDIDAMDANLCYGTTAMDVNDPDAKFEVVDCPEKIDAIKEETKNLADLSLYQQCGQCPNAHNLESFLNALVEHKDGNQVVSQLVTSGVETGCAGSGDYPKYISALANAFNFGTFDSFVYKSVPTTEQPLGYAKLRSTFQVWDGPSCWIDFAFTYKTTATAPYPQEAANIMDNISSNGGIRNLYDFTDIKRICCLKYITDPVRFDLTQNRNFQFTATVLVKNGDPLYEEEEDPITHVKKPIIKYRELIIEGLSNCFDVGGCPFDPICKASKEAKQLQNLFNALTYKAAGTTTSAFSDLNTETDLSTAHYNASYQVFRPLLNRIYGLDANLEPNWKWDAISKSNMDFSANFNATVNGTNYSSHVTLNVADPNGPHIGDFVFDDIASFSHIIPIASSTSTTHRFEITALVKKSGTPSYYIKLEGSAWSIKMGECSTTLPGSMGLGDTKTSLDGLGLVSCEPTTEAKALQTELTAACTAPASNFSCSGNTLTLQNENFPCTVQLQFPEGSEYAYCTALPGNYNYLNFVSFTGIKPDPDFAVAGLANHNFIIYAVLSTGVKVQLKGKVPCIEVGSCHPVAGDCKWADNRVDNGNFEQGPFDQGPVKYTSEYIPTKPMNGINQYALVKDANEGFGQSYYGKDHTSGSGYFIAARSDGSNKRIWKQSNNISINPNTFYRFTAWVGFPVNNAFVASANDPFFELVINKPLPNGNETELAKKDIPLYSLESGEWKQIEFTWFSGDNTLVNLEIRDGLLTNHDHYFFELDDIAFQACQTMPLCDIITIPPPKPYVDPNPCKTQLTKIATHNAEEKYAEYVNGLSKQFQENYIKKCLNVYEEFTMKHWDTQHHFTLYYYDQAGNLVRTVPPQGVRKITDIDPDDPADGPARVAAEMEQIKLDRFNHTHTVFTKHTMATTYQYNSLNQLIAQTSPDVKNLEIWKTELVKQGIPTDAVVTNTVFTDAYHGNAFTKDNNGVGHIYFTADGGKHWIETTSIGLLDLNDVQFATSTIAYAVGKGGIILKTDGTTVSNIGSPTKQELFRMLFTSAGTGDVYEKNGTQWHTDNDGTSWTQLSSLKNMLASGDLLTDIRFYSTNAIAVSQYGKIYVSTNSGTSWNASTTIRTTDLNKVFTVGSNKRYAIGKDGRFLRSDDGASWQLVDRAISSELKNMFFDYTSRGFIIDENGKVWKTDGVSIGAEITLQNTTTNPVFKDISFNGKEGYAVTSTGSYSKFNGDKWTEPTAAIPGANGINKMFCIGEFASSKIGFMAGADGKIYKYNGTTDSWVQISQTLVTEDIIDMHFAQDGTDIKGTLLTSTDKLYYFNSTVGGSNLTITQKLPAVAWTAIQFANEKDGYAISQDGTVASTTTYGSSWTQIASPTANNAFRSISMFVDGANGVACGQNGELWKVSAANGWENVSSNMTLPYMAAVAFVDANTAYAVGKNGVIVKTSDAGTTWEQDITKSSANYATVSFSGMEQGMAAGSGGSSACVYGEWDQPINTTSLRRIAFSPAGDAVYGVGAGGGVLKSTNLGTSWTSLTGAPNLGLNGLAMNASLLLTVGENGIVLRSPLTGTQSMTKVSSFDPPVINAAASVGQTTIAVGNKGYIVGSTTGGNVWTVQPSGKDKDLNGIYLAPDVKNAIAVGKAGTALETSTGGSDWSPLSLTGSSGIDLKDVDVHGDFGVMVGTGGNAYVKTKNTTWTLQDNNTTHAHGNTINAVYVVDETMAYAVGDAGTILQIKVAANNAVIWTDKTRANTGKLTDVFFRDYTTGYAIGDGGVLLKTTDHGDNWAPENLNNTPVPDYTDFSVINNNNLIISGTNGNVTHLEDMKDEFASLFWYDKFGRLVVSQNGKQYNKEFNGNKDHLTYSYTLYDELGRIKEVGEVHSSATSNADGIYGAIENLYQNGQLNPAALNTWVSRGTRTEITTTVYDDKAYTRVPTDPNYPDYKQENLLKRVSATFLNSDGINGSEYATYYSYDIHGNVKSLLHENIAMATLDGAQRFKQIDYAYDLISGSVKQVNFQDGKMDAFYHKYEYDADNRITNVFTSKDNVIWDQDAKYFYYKHGPLSRVELGNEKVQGVDYAYTLQGWIKGVNSANLNAENDIGEDGGIADANNIHKNIARDAYSYSLNYYLDKFNQPTAVGDFEGDYKRIGATADPTKNKGNEFLASTVNIAYMKTTNPLEQNANKFNLYNGNISSMVTTIMDNMVTADLVVSPQLTAYKYDQLNRIKEMNAYDNGTLTSYDWVAAANNGSYHSEMTYDANGNITDMVTNGNTLRGEERMDDLHYTYENTKKKDKNNVNYLHNTNKLRSVKDNVLDSSDPTDIETQDGDNYDYDEIGNLTQDLEEGITKIDWTVYGKIKTIESNAPKSNLEFTYDAQGNRVSKTEKLKANGGQIITFYVRDASGNVMSTYKKKESGNDVYLQEQNLFGSSRLGVNNIDLNLTSPPVPTPNMFARVVGNKGFELSNHLGNVLTTVSDRRIANEGSGGLIAYSEADVQMATDYYSFGAAMQKRGKNGTYRYGFNGKEKDDEVSGNGNQYDYGFRIYNPRLGRFLSIDPLSPKYPMLTPYQFASNTPIWAIDMDGLEATPISNNTNILVICIQGFGGDPKKNETLAKNAGVSAPGLGIDNGGLGALQVLEKMVPLLQVTVYASDTKEDTKNDVLTTIKNFKTINPNGKVVIVGHSQGADNGIELVKENPDIKVDLLITLDAQEAKNYLSYKGIPLITGIDDNNVPENVANAINYYQTSEAIGGETIDFDPSKTNGANILSPGSNHRSIDNDQKDNVIKDIWIFSNYDGKTAVNAASMQKQPTYNPADTGSPNVIDGKSNENLKKVKSQ
jgi:RHS repeat-associated protein